MADKKTTIARVMLLVGIAVQIVAFSTLNWRYGESTTTTHIPPNIVILDTNRIYLGLIKINVSDG